MNVVPVSRKHPLGSTQILFIFVLFCSVVVLFRMESRSACEWIINTFSGEEYPGQCLLSLLV